MLNLALGLTPGAAGAWCEPWVAAAAGAGIAAGESPTLFAPDQPATRQERTVLVARALNLQAGAEVRLPFTDAAATAPWAALDAARLSRPATVAGFPGRHAAAWRRRHPRTGCDGAGVDAAARGRGAFTARGGARSPLPRPVPGAPGAAWTEPLGLCVRTPARACADGSRLRGRDESGLPGGGVHPPSGPGDRRTGRRAPPGAAVAASRRGRSLAARRFRSGGPAVHVGLPGTGCGRAPAPGTMALGRALRPGGGRGGAR